MSSSRPTEPPKQMDRESVVFLIDASPAMLRRAPGATTHAVDGARPDAATGRGGAGSAVTTYLDVALDCARGMLRDRVVSAPSDKQGVVFFNTTRTRGLDDHLDGLSARENVYVYHRAAPPSARRIQDLGDLIGRDNRARFRETVGVRDVERETSDGSTEGASTEALRNASASATYYDALLRAHHVAREMLNDHPPTQRVAKRCLLFTNRDAPLPDASSVDDATARLREDGRELIGQWREFANVHKIDVRLFALPRTISDDERDAESSDAPLRVAPFDASKFYDNLVTCCADEEEDEDAREGERSGDASETKTGGRASERAEGVLTPTGHELVAFHASGDDGAIHASNGGFGLDSVTRAFRARTRRMRKVRSVALRFGRESGEKIAVSLYAPFAAAKRPKPVKVHCRDLSEVHCETVFVNTAVGAYVEREALTKKFIHVGDKKAVVTQDELADAKRAVAEEGIHLFGFREDSASFRETFLRWARTGRPARLARPEGADDADHKKGRHERRDAERMADAVGSSGGGDTSRSETASKKNAACFFALVDAMRRRRRVGVGITARTGSRDAGARGCVLVPAEDADGELIGLRVIDAPFADDVRHPERVHDFKRMADATAAASELTSSAFDAVAGSRGATAAQVRSAEDVIDALAVHAYDPADIANPALARHYRVLECQALDAPWTDADERDVDGTKPPSSLELERVGVRGPIEAFKVCTYGVNHDAESLEDASVKPPPSKRPKALGGGLEDDPIDFVALAKSNDLERCTAAALKAYCKERGLKTTGVKSALAERVKEHALDGGR